MAFVLAVGLSFAVERGNLFQTQQAIEVGGQLYSVSTSCDVTNPFPCVVQLTDDQGNDIGSPIGVKGLNPSTGEYDVDLFGLTEEPTRIPESSLEPIE